MALRLYDHNIVIIVFFFGQSFFGYVIIIINSLAKNFLIQWKII